MPKSVKKKEKTEAQKAIDLVTESLDSKDGIRMYHQVNKEEATEEFPIGTVLFFRVKQSKGRVCLRFKGVSRPLYPHNVCPEKFLED